MTPFPCQIIRSSRRTIAIQLTPEGQVIVRCPHRTSQAAIRALLQERAGWIQSHLEQIRSQPVLPAFSQAELAALTEQARQELPGRVAFWAEQVGVTWNRITVRHQHTLWGSCTAGGNLSFNCLLMCVPEPVRDYVVVHELCHRKQMNHSPAFWAEVGRVLPDYETRRGWLRENGGSLIRRLPASGPNSMEVSK